MEPNDPPTLRTVGPAHGETDSPLSLRRAGDSQVNPTAELVADLLSATELVPEDKLALVRGRAGQTGSLAQALVDEGVATSEGVARMLAQLGYQGWYAWEDEPEDRNPMLSAVRNRECIAKLIAAEQ